MAGSRAQSHGAAQATGRTPRDAACLKCESSRLCVDEDSECLQPIVGSVDTLPTAGPDRRDIKDAFARRRGGGSQGDPPIVTARVLASLTDPAYLDGASGRFGSSPFSGAASDPGFLRGAAHAASLFLLSRLDRQNRPIRRKFVFEVPRSACGSVPAHAKRLHSIACGTAPLECGRRHKKRRRKKVGLPLGIEKRLILIRESSIGRQPTV